MSFANDLVRKSSPGRIKPRGKTCNRVTNQYGVVFRTDDGKASTADLLGEVFNISRYYVKKIYTENNKDYLIANPILANLSTSQAG